MFVVKEFGRPTLARASISSGAYPYVIAVTILVVLFTCSHVLYAPSPVHH